MNKLMQKIQEELGAQRGCVLAVIVAAEGSTPGKVGAKMLVGRDGRLCGTVGGGALELKSIRTAQELLEAKRSRLCRWELQQEGGQALGMACGGSVEVLFSYIAGGGAWPRVCEDALACMKLRGEGWLLLSPEDEPPALYEGGGCPAGPTAPEAGGALTMRAPARLSGGRYAVPLTVAERLLIFGAGHVAQALTPLAAAVGFQVTVYDDRAEFAAPGLFPEAQTVICGDYSRISLHLQVSGEDYVAIMTNGHANDLVVQEQIMRGQYAYLGVIGSRRKTEALNRQLLARGFSQQALDGVHTPIGLAIRAVTPEEIAVSIAAELIQVRACSRDPK